MEILSEFVISVTSALGINENMAILLFFLFMGAFYSLIRQSKQEVRLNMHADHFDVLDKTHSEALSQSSTALRDAAYAKGYVDGFASNIKED